tara:strand:+ start:67197 stop:68027 length:831 start_codon:yes stop_codon:yes gene_type:complete
MKLIILTEGGYNHDSSKLSGKTTVDILEMDKILDDPSRWAEDISKLTEIHVVGFDVENITGDLFGIMADSNLEELFSMKKEDLPKFDVALTRKMPKLVTGDIVAIPMLGSRVAIYRINYDPVYNLTKMLEIPPLSSRNLLEGCKLKTPKATVQYVPNPRNPETCIIFPPKGARPITVVGKNAPVYGVAELFRNKLVEGQIDNKPPFNVEISDARLLELARMVIDNKQNGKLSKVENKLITEVTKEYVWPYSDSYWRGVRNGLMFDIKEALQKHGLY